jgi:glycosyltransferase involved in cell wall biosynthesis
MISPPSPKPSISAFLPCLNEAGNIADTMGRLARALADICDRYEVIVVDDGSTDDTAAIVQKLSGDNPNLRLVSHPHNLGYGRAVASGIAAARYDWVFFSDGDGQFDFADLYRFVPYIPDYSLIVGYRRRRQEGFRRTLTSKVYNMVVRLCFGLRMHDIDCSFKLMRRDIFERIKVESMQFFVDTEMMTKAHNLGYRMKELPVQHLARRMGKSTIRMKHILSTIGEMRRQWRTIKSLRPL